MAKDSTTCLDQSLPGTLWVEHSKVKILLLIVMEFCKLPLEKYKYSRFEELYKYLSFMKLHLTTKYGIDSFKKVSVTLNANIFWTISFCILRSIVTVLRRKTEVMLLPAHIRSVKLNAFFVYPPLFFVPCTTAHNGMCNVCNYIYPMLLC
jgi:hypothetical protein